MSTQPVIVPAQPQRNYDRYFMTQFSPQTGDTGNDAIAIPCTLRRMDDAGNFDPSDRGASFALDDVRNLPAEDLAAIKPLLDNFDALRAAVLASPVGSGEQPYNDGDVVLEFLCRCVLAIAQQRGIVK